MNCVLFSIEEDPNSFKNAVYLQWQSLLLHDSAVTHGVIEDADVLQLLSANHEPINGFPGERFVTPNRRYNEELKDEYSVYNRIYAIRDWLDSGQADKYEKILLLDPDMIFVSRFDWDQPVPSGQIHWYLSGDAEDKHWVFVRHSSVQDNIDPVGWPLLVTREHLGQIIEPWIKKTVELRRDLEVREKIRWTTDMWAYVIACAELGIRHQFVDYAHYPLHNWKTRPLLHYCYSLQNEAHDFVWNKRDYQPWEIPPLPPACSTPNVLAFFSALVKLVEQQRADEG